MFPQLYSAIPGHCASDGSVTHTQLPCGIYLCSACVRFYQERGWLDAAFEFTEAYPAKPGSQYWFQVRRKGRDKVVIDSGRLVTVLRTMLASGESIEGALRRLQTEARVGFFHLVPAVAVVLELETREARRLVVQAVGSDFSGKPAIPLVVSDQPGESRGE